MRMDGYGVNSYAIPQSTTGSRVDLVECRSRQYEIYTGAYEVMESRASYAVEVHKASA